MSGVKKKNCNIHQTFFMSFKKIPFYSVIKQRLMITLHPQSERDQHGDQTKES